MSAFLPEFSQYDVVVLDYNGDRWNEQTDARFVDYIQQGGGLVVYHAANNAFADWPEYNRIICFGGWEGRDEQSGPYIYLQDDTVVYDETPGPGGSHGPQHPYIVYNTPSDHPVMKGLPAQWFHAKDELYDRMRGPGKVKEVLCSAFSTKDWQGSGKEELTAFTVDYGKARIFHITMGHAGSSLEDNEAMQCAGFQTLLLRGTEWAATGKVTQPLPADFPTTKISLRQNYQEP